MKQRFRLATLLALLAFFGLFVGFTAHAQVDSMLKAPGAFMHPHSVQLDAGGPGLFYSVNYEYVFANGSDLKASIRAGVAAYPPMTVIALWLPVTAQGIISLGKHHVEVGGGAIPVRNDWLPRNDNYLGGPWSMFLTGRIGYRYQKPNGRLVLKAAFTPVIEPEFFSLRSGNALQSWLFHPLGGLTVGYAF